MPFIVPAIAGVLGLGVIGQALIGTALSLALGAAARALAPKPGAGVGSQGMRLSLRTEAAPSREIIFGTAATAGHLVYHHTFGPTKNEYLHLVFALADCECEALESIYVNGAAVSWNPLDETVAEFPGLMWIKFHSGAYGQDADTDLVDNSDGRLTSADRGRGICYVRVKLKYDPNKFPSRPEFLFVVKGAKLYDWRLDSTAGGSGPQRWGQPATYAWTDNPIVQLYNWRRGIWLYSAAGVGQRIAGMNAPAAALPADYWTPAANACNDLLGLAGGGTEKRYRSNGVVTTAATNRDVIIEFLKTVAGQEIETAGVIKPYVGVAQSPVMTITDADYISGADVEISSRRPRNELVNAIFGTYTDPAALYHEAALPPRLSPALEAEDGGVRLDESYALEFVTSPTQGQRILEIWRRRHRQQPRAKLRLRARCAALEAGDWIIWDSSRYGYSGSVWEVTASSLAADKTVSLTLRAISADCYAWSTGDELSMTAPGTLPAPAPTYSTVAGLAVALVAVDSGAAQGATRPGLQITWTAPTDMSVIELAVEFRRQGDTIALERRTAFPLAGSYTWIDGVQGGTRYEVRVKPVTYPVRPTEWTAWTLSAADTPVVAVSIPAGSITPDKLDAQTQFELSLETALADAADSTNARIAELQADLARAAEAAHDGLARVHVESLDRRASIQEFERVFIDANTAIAQQITTLETSVGGNSAAVIDLSESVDGIRARRTIAVTNNNEVVGSVDISGENGVGVLTLLANVLRVAANEGGVTVPMFDTSVIDGSTVMHLYGDLIARAIKSGKVEAGEVAAAFASLGLIRAGRMLSTNNKMDINLDAGTFEILA